MEILRATTGEGLRPTTLNVQCSETSIASSTCIPPSCSRLYLVVSPLFLEVLTLYMATIVSTSISFYTNRKGKLISGAIISMSLFAFISLHMIQPS